MGKSKTRKRERQQLQHQKQRVLSLASLPTPWYVLPLYEDGKFMLANISDLKKEKNCFRSFPEICGKRCVASMHGWLVMKDFDYDHWRRRKVHCFLFNPETREVIVLPFRNSQDFHTCRSCFLSAPPTDPDCVILFIETERKFFLFFHLQGEDNKWRKQYYDKDVEANDWFSSNTMACSNGTIYALTFRERFATIRRKPCGTGLVVRLLDIKEPIVYSEAAFTKSYMFESFGEIYFAVLLREACSNTINRVEISKMNFSTEAWEKVDCLGNIVFMLSDYGCMSFPTTNNSQIEGNSIYIISGHRVLVYGIHDESLVVYLPFLDLGRPFQPFWLISSKISHVVEEVNNNSTVAATEENDGEESVGGGANWMELPVDILSKIPTYLLFGIDYMNFRLVCKAWKEAVLPIRETNTSPNASTTPQCPWLMSFNRDQGQCIFLDPVSNFTRCADLSELVDAQICFTKDGWLLLSKGERSMFFFNPFNNVTIKLPDLPKRFGFSGLSFSSLPSLPDCIVFCIKKTGFLVEICYLRRGEKAWSWLEFKDQGRIILATTNPVFYDGAFYCLGGERHLGVFDLKDGKDEWTILETFHPISKIIPQYLVEVSGEFLSISVPREGMWVDVHKLDRLHMSWTLLESLENQMIFVSRFMSILLKTTTETMQNRIYFPMTFNNNNTHVFYSLDTKRWHSLSGDYSREDISNTKEQRHCTWIHPTLTWTRDCS